MSRDAKKLDMLPCLLAAVVGVRYWVFAALFAGGEPIDIWTLYRFGDLQFLPQIAALAGGCFTECAVFEQTGEHLMSGQLLQFGFYGLFWALGGPYGLIAADAIVAALCCWALLWLFRECALNGFFAKLTAVIIGGGLLGEFQLGSVADVFLYHARWGRPHLTVPVLVALLALIASLMNTEQQRLNYRRWAVLGLLLSLLIQFGDPFSAVSIGVTTALFWLSWVVTQTTARRRLIRCALYALGVFGLATLPLALQLTQQHPDFSIRMGVTGITRFPPLFEFPGLSVFVPWSIVLLLLGVYCERTRSQADARRYHWLRFLFSLNIATMLALPLSCLLFGVVTQPYHFKLSTILIYSHTAVLLFLATLPSRALPKYVSSTGLVALALGLTLLFELRLAVHPYAARLSLLQSPLRSDMNPEQVEQQTYREDLNQLIEELQRPPYRSAQVLATFDHQLAVWWHAFHRGYLFNPDPFFTTLSDEQVEQRLLQLLQLTGAHRESVIAFLDRRVAVFWIGHNKYQFSQAARFSDFDQYTPEQRLRYGSSIYDNWSIAIPQDELKRLQRRFVTQSPWNGSPRLDLVILTNTQSEIPLAIRSDRFALQFQNTTFRAYLRAGTDAPD